MEVVESNDVELLRKRFAFVLSADQPALRTVEVEAVVVSPNASLA